MSGTEPPGRRPRPAPSTPPPTGFGSLVTPQTAGAGGMLIMAAALAALVAHCQATPAAPTSPKPTASVSASQRQ